VEASQPGKIEVEDQLERRIRKPVDLLRCVVSWIGIVALAVAGIAASATMSGVETDIAAASRRLPHALLVVVPPLALFALLILPVAMAVQLLVRRQFRRLAEAAATGVLAGATPRRSTPTWPAWSPTPPWPAWPAGRTGGTPCGRRSPRTRSCTWECCTPPS
jgi:hypothetical protein